MLRNAKEAQREMRKLIALIRGFVFRHSPVFYEQKRLKLSKRFRSVLNMDSIDGITDSETRRVFFE